MKRALSPSPLEDLRLKIRTVGLRSTVPRVAVLHVLQTATIPESRAELFAILVDQGFDRATT